MVVIVSRTIYLMLTTLVYSSFIKVASERDGRHPHTYWLSTFDLASLNDSAASRRQSAAAAAGSISSRHGGVGAGVESENTSEGASEVRVEDGVDEGIEETVDVAEPRDEADHGRRDGPTTRLTTERSHGGYDEERKPADDERARDDR